MNKVKIIGQVVVNKKQYPVKARYISSVANSDILNISIADKKKNLGFMNLSIPRDDKPICILLMKSLQNIKGIGSHLLQTAIKNPISILILFF